MKRRAKRMARARIAGCSFYGAARYMSTMVDCSGTPGRQGFEDVGLRLVRRAQ